MGRLVHTLRRRDAHEPELRSEKSEVGIEAARPSTSDSSLLNPTIDWPFIEVPEASASRPIVAPTPLAQSMPRAVTVNGSTEPPEVHFHRRPALPPTTPAGIASDLVLWREPTGPAAIQFRQVAEAIRIALSAENLRTLLLLPLEASPQQMAPAANLALAMAESGGKTLLVDANPHSGQLHRLFGLAAAPGWTELLNAMPSPQTIQDTGWYCLHLIAAGNRLVGAASPLQGEKLRGIVDELRSRYDLLLLQAPPWTTGGMTAVLSHLCDAVCLLLGKKQVDQPAETRCLDALRSERLRVLGSVVAGQ